jgi:hypothetical protein
MNKLNNENYYDLSRYIIVHFEYEVKSFSKNVQINLQTKNLVLYFDYQMFRAFIYQ